MPEYTIDTHEAYEEVDTNRVCFTLIAPNGVRYKARISKRKLEGATSLERAKKLAQWVLDQRPFPGGERDIALLAQKRMTVTTHFETVVDPLDGLQKQREVVDTVTVVQL